MSGAQQTCFAVFCLFIVFRFTKSFADLLTGKSMPYAQNCLEFGLFSENHQTGGILRADVSQLEDGLRG